MALLVSLLLVLLKHFKAFLSFLSHLPHLKGRFLQLLRTLRIYGIMLWTAVWGVLPFGVQEDLNSNSLAKPVSIRNHPPSSAGH